MVVLPAAETARRSRAQDLATLLIFAATHMGTVDCKDQNRGLEFGVYLTVKDCCRQIKMEKALYNPVGNRHHYSQEQLDYVRSLIEDLPKVLRHVLVVAGIQTPPRLSRQELVFTESQPPRR